MPRRVHEIFSSQGQSEANQGGSNDASHQNGVGNRKSTPAPMPPFKRFGGYKPKILAGTDGIGPVNDGGSPTKSPPTSPTELHLPRPVLTKPKPFIIGDKNVPMVLSTVGDVDDEATRHLHGDAGVNETSIYATVEDIGVNSNPYNTHIPYDNGIDYSHPDSRQEDDSFFHPNDRQDLIDEEATTSFTAADFATENPAFSTGPESEPVGQTNFEDAKGPESERIQQTSYDVSTGSESERIEHTSPEETVDGLLIPEPDYDEMEESMDFVEEELEEAGEPRAPPQRPMGVHTLPPLSKRHYWGEDWSHYLSDDDDDKESMEMTSRSGKGRKMSGKLGQKNILFKSPANNNINNVNHHNSSNSVNHYNGKNKNKVRSPSHNSVRSFSYADSKLGTKGRANGKTLALVSGGEDFQDDSYESFLISRHGHTMPSRIPNVAMKEMGQWSGAKPDDAKLWKKLTYRLKKKNKNGYALNEM